MNRTFLPWITCAAFGAVLVSTTPASAHDVHTFGTVTVALGWLHEPAYVGVDNAVQVLVKDSNGTPITQITDHDLTVDVSLDNEKLSAQKLVPSADPDTGLGAPGEYEMHFIPTVPGNYTFHIVGTVGGQVIDETVTASDTTFDEVTSAAAAEFPTQVPAPSELSLKLDQTAARDHDAIDNAQRWAEVAAGLGLIALIAVVLLGITSRRKSTT